MQITWTRYLADWRAEIGNVTLSVSPDRTTGVLGDRPARGTSWRACVSVWDEASKCISSYGRDCYGVECANVGEAKALALATFTAERDRLAVAAE